MTTLIANAHIISPDFELQHGAIALENGFISGVYRSDQPIPQADKHFDAQGQYAFPGFIDIHAHGAAGADLCDNDLESIRHIAKQKLAEGVTTWLPTTLTQPQQILLEIADKCKQYRAKQEFVKTPGIHLEGPYINSNKAGAQNPQHVRQASIEELHAIHAVTPICLLSLAPCQRNAIQLIAAADQLEILTSAAHTEADYTQIASAKRAGLSQLTHFGNAMTGLHHREIGTVGAGLLDDDLSLELICDGIHLSPEFIQLVFKLKSIDRIQLITDSMAGSWLTNGSCSLGGLDVIVENKVARLKKSGALAGSTLTYNQGLKLAAEYTKLPLTQLVKTTSLNQAQALGFSQHGKIEKGFTADIAILDTNLLPTATFVDGQQRF
ncbi:N-acetylglucosamine-6-phosphate deacetylase [Rubritalea spongiae]|uniref:N-acetylglucosamine-6-phosphate deacetylase n=1 Tax=Rubritalea spongiae TaxID=430797 RepID=A0ABW5E2Q7_9BACT